MNKFLKLDWIMLGAVALLLIIGLLALYSISYEDASSLYAGNLARQSVSIAIGLGLMFFLAFFDYRILNSYSTKLYFLGLVLLGLVIVFGKTVNGHTGWLNFAGLSLQPVEIVKLILIIFLASFLSKKKNQLSIVVRIIVSVVLVFIPIYLIMKQPDLGSATIVVGCWGLLLFVSGLSKKNLAIMVIIGAVLATSSWFFLKPYQKDRIVNLVRPERDPRGSGYNVLQAIVAVGSGGIAGNGLGHGSQAQLNFLPEKNTDFIFSVLAEELGFVGSLSILILYGVFFWRLKEAARMARDNFGYLIVVGVMAMVFLQVLVNVGMNIGVMPVTGVPLPLLSFGGSSIITVLASVGIVESIYMRRIKE
jgi:rod shape determining protein RodA